MFQMSVKDASLYFQDFELWDDVGLNIPKPPDLLQLYRNCGTPLPSPRDTVDVAVGVDFGDFPGNCIAQDPPKKPDLSQQVCMSVPLCMFMVIQEGKTLGISTFPPRWTSSSTSLITSVFSKLSSKFLNRDAQYYWRYWYQLIVA